MATSATLDRTTCESEKDAWDILYPWLFPQVKRWVSDSDVPTWSKQINDVSSDITQEAITRVFRTNERAEQGNAPPIASLKGFTLIVARNYFKDLRRKEARLVHFSPSPTPSEDQSQQNLALILEPDDAIEHMINYLFLQEIMVILANIIADLPARQRTALLITLAADLPIQPTAQKPLTLLQKALADRGIPLQHYQYAKPTDECMKKRFAANLHAARQQVIKRYRATRNAERIQPAYS